MRRASSLLILLLAAAVAASAAPAPPNAPRLIRLAPQSTAKQVGAFHYRLLPDPLDQTPGNAAPLWRFASDVARRVKRRLTPKEEVAWLGGIPLRRLPQQEMADFLAQHAATFRLARQAACRQHCDWEIPLLTLQTIPEAVPSIDVLVQTHRELLHLLCIRYRFQLAQGRYDEAAETLQIGFALARHFREGDLILQNLVGIAFFAILFGHVEEWVQNPGSPNLYWALTALPRPLANVRRSIEYELNTLHRSLPRLRRLRQETLTARQAEELVKEYVGILNKMANESLLKEAEKIRKLGESLRVGESYPQARRHLLDLGRAVKEIEAMPKAQVVLLWYVDRYDKARDNILKAVSLPMWQAAPLMEAASQEYQGGSDSLLALLVPILDKTWVASMRSERQLASLRCAEALRQYAAAHKGKPPAKWSDITAVPLPVDPVTGKGFEEFYQVNEGHGVLEVPIGKFVFLGRRYELAPDPAAR